MDRRRLTILGAAGAMACVLALAGPAMAEDQASSKTAGLLAGWSAVPAEELGETRAMGAEADIDLTATNDSSSTASQDGSLRKNIISDGAFRDFSGVGVVVQNNGDGNIFQIVTQVEVNMN